MAIDVLESILSKYGGTPPLQEMRVVVQLVTPDLENRVFDARSNRVARLTVYALEDD